MCTRVERICQVDPEGWYAPVIGEELVRCKDCKWYEMSEEETYCRELGIFDTDFRSYCSYAKRKEE